MPGPFDDPHPNVSLVVNTSVGGTNIDAADQVLTVGGAGAKGVVRKKARAQQQLLDLPRDVSLLLAGETFLAASRNEKIPRDLRARLEKKGVGMILLAAD